MLHNLVTETGAGTPDDKVPMVFDRAKFLSRLEGDELLAKEIIEMFLQECPKLLQNVRDAAQQRNARLLERAAHALKGSVGDVDAPEAFDAARILELMARNGELEGVENVVMSLEAVLQRLDRVLRNPENRAA